MYPGILAFLLAVITLVISIVCFLVLEPTIGPKFAFWPGFILQWFLEKFGLPTTNRILPWASLGFWWASIWLALVFFKRSRGHAA
jgi:hypothetical protein